MCKYEKDPMSIVEDTERTRFCQQTDKVKPVYPPFNFVEAEGTVTNGVNLFIKLYFKSGNTVHNLHPVPFIHVFFYSFAQMLISGVFFINQDNGMEK